ncbi:MAG: bifunctional phosphopantothenoylcysteine decarboxylase/phosphopantothenate--cysteine ligase CoaBC [Thermodesulfobacteriota bacterium]|nr:bifunctional phosphopantothenoylcysteine decarboxylase/phosphopantothenate--cysteine ligase CoaBC [Thermodesulfobacteriota bacterium]
MADTHRQTLKTVVLGISGGIAAYKAPLIVRGLVGQGIEVYTILTDAASRFVTADTLETLSTRPVYSEMFLDKQRPVHEVEHVALADKADLFVVAPATANTIAKLAHGIADSPLTCTALATTAPVLICPSMNVNMLSNPATQENLKTLKDRGLHILEPETGELACGWEGSGRLPDPSRIVDEIGMLLSAHDLEHTKILVVTGPTCEDIDPVRYITNRSTGRMGTALTEAACLRGAQVKVISGPVQVKYAPWAQIIPVRSAREMLHAVQEALGDADVLIMCAAVADYYPTSYNKTKIKKDSGLDHIALSQGPDILSTIREKKDGHVFVGFAAETQNLVLNANQKMEKKGLDMIVANQINKKGSGFASDTDTGTILMASGEPYPFKKMEKSLLAHHILDRVLDLIKGQS